MLDKSTLVSLLPRFYEAYHTPVYLLKEDFEIAYQPNNFIPLSNDFFIRVFKNRILKEGKINTLFCKSELYLLFAFEDEPIKYVCMGPLLYRKVNYDVNINSISFFKEAKAVGSPISLLQKVSYIDDYNIGIAKLIYQLCRDEELIEEDIHNSYTERREYVPDEKIATQIQYQRREYVPIGNSYQDEWNLLHFVKLGNTTLARVYASKIAGKNNGKMSDDPFRKNQYTLVALITLLTRTVLEVGVSIERAYTISDTHIQRIDQCFSAQQLYTISNDAIVDFCNLVRNNEHSQYPKWIRSCHDYIHEHLHTTISLEAISENVHMAPAYVSVQYKKVTGNSLSQYINTQRMLEAQYLLKNTEMSIQEIAMNLNYSTQSYFTKIFKSKVGVLPNEFRRSK